MDPKNEARDDTITLSKTPFIAALMVLVSVGLAAGAFFVGQGTRDSRPEVKKQVASAVNARAKLAARDQARAVKTARAVQKKNTATTWKATMKKAVEKAKDEAYDTGYENGQNAGYSAGQSAGYSAGQSAGHEAGVEEGIEEASDELMCSDDNDVDLPPCFDF